MREFAVPPVATVDTTSNLTDPVWSNATEVPDTVQFARRTAGGWQDVTCAQFRDEVVAVARGLLAAGVGAGDRVALMSKTRYEWTLLDYAIWAAGGVTVPIYETSSPEQIRWILADSGAVACLVETAVHEAAVAALREELPALREVWRIEPAGDSDPNLAAAKPLPPVRIRSQRNEERNERAAGPGMTTEDGGGAVDTLVAAGAGVTPEQVEQRRRAVRAEDLATIIYTSGTTGRPKGCMLTHRNMYTDTVNSVAGLPFLFEEGASTLLFLPLAHSFARLIQLGTVQARARLGHTPDVKNLVAELTEFQPTYLLSVPRVFEKVYNTARQRAHADGKGAIFDRAEHAAIAYSEALDAGGPGLAVRAWHGLFERLVYGKLRAALGGRCRYAISAGAPLGLRLAHFFRGIGVTVYEGYGLTETSPGLTSNTTAALRVGTVGQPIPGVTIRIADDGEILAKGDVVFQGYWNNPEATADVISEDGWFRTGDLGQLDEDGYLRITGRKKEIIVTAGGKNVAPAVLEDRLRAHPLISQCMVVGDRQPFVAALVTIDEEAWPAWLAAHDKPAETDVAQLRGDQALRSEIQQAVDEANKAVSKAEAIREFRILERDWSEATGEITPSLKVKRNVVLKEYADEIASIYTR